MRRLLFLIALVVVASGYFEYARAQDTALSYCLSEPAAKDNPVIAGLQRFALQETNRLAAFQGAAVTYPDRFSEGLADWCKEDSPPAVNFDVAAGLKSALDGLKFSASGEFSDIKILDPETFKSKQNQLGEYTPAFQPFVVGDTGFAVTDSALKFIDLMNGQEKMLLQVRWSGLLRQESEIQATEQDFTGPSHFEALESNTGTGIDSVDLSQEAGSEDSCKAGTGPEACLLPVVALVRAGAPFCSGILIGPDKVLTAAHCICDGWPAKNDANALPVTVFFGSNATLTQPRFSRWVNVKGEPDFFGKDFCHARDLHHARERSAHPEGDVAIITLEQTVILPSNELLPRILAPGVFLSIAEFEVAGFGATSATGYPSYKNWTRLIVHSYNCTDLGAKESPFEGKCHAGTEFATNGFVDGADSCHGDSGAPVYIRNGDHLAIAGIVSRGLDATCGPGGIQTLLNTDLVMTWLRSHVPDIRTTASASQSLASALSGAGLLK